MQVTFLLGPAGTGKTHRCLAEIRRALEASAEGPPLLLLAPKQATFQLERQLLSDPDLPGYTRLQILSFERLAEFVLAEFAPSPRLLDDEGRVMVLRALLAKMERERKLEIFHAAARLPGFASQLSLLLREFQRHQLSPEKLAAVFDKPGLTTSLTAKLRDLAAVLRAYLDWLKAHGLEDANRLLDLATETMRAARSRAATGNAPAEAPIRFAGLWLDGFAEMTPQEVALLAELVPVCEQATLAFCLEREPQEETSWLSTWSVVAQTFRQCHQRIMEVAGGRVSVEVLARRPAIGRFSASPPLRHLEERWTDPAPFRGANPGAQDNSSGFRVSSAESADTGRNVQDAVRLAACVTPEAEATLAAHEILQHVRGGGRFRDCAVLVRTLDGYYDVLRRVFTRYEIPFFLDRREPVAHHPLAELTRYALRTAAFGWKQNDWFGVLKTGLLPTHDADIDWLENAALEHGWEGEFWHKPMELQGRGAVEHDAERLRGKLVPPFLDLAGRLAARQYRPSGRQLAEALRALWGALDVEGRLEDWSDETDSAGTSAQPMPTALHTTVWEQMQAWLDNLERAFPDEPMTVNEWLPIIEAGLSGLTVGVIPPALDQVLVGAIDRSRNPDLQLALVLGLNEGVFPAPPPPAVLLTDADREELENHRVALGPNRKLRLGHERYFAYIACTRARRRLVLTYATTDADGSQRHPSLFVDHLRRLFPQLPTESFSVTASRADEAGMVVPSAPASWLLAQHACELTPVLLRNKARSPAVQSQALAALESLPVFAPVVSRWKEIVTATGQKLSPAVAAALYGPELQTSVSALENFAECPFKFFVARGLRAEERKRFEVDERAQGTFQHEVLKEFHWNVRGQGRRWRDVPSVEACVMIRRIAEDLLPRFQGGLFLASEAGRFRANLLIDQLERFIGVLIDWMAQYEFDPHAAEVDFGLPEARLPAWRLPLDDGRALLLRGRIDRLDLWFAPDEEEAMAVVLDYKSRVRPLDPTKLHHGLQLQLLAYLGLLRHLEQPEEIFHVPRLVPAGVFYIGLGSEGGSGATRGEVLGGQAEARKSGCRHTGRFNGEFLRLFDNRADATVGDQFKFQINKDGGFAARGNEALTPEQFARMLDDVENHLRRIGCEIFAGEVRVAPYRKNSETACQRCEFRAVCRFDPWVEPYRVLRPPPKDAPEG